MKPEELLYAKTHEWVQVAPDTQTVTVGFSQFALEALTDLVFLDLPAIGRKVEAGQPLGEVESVKAVSDIYSPVDGEIVEVNSDLPDRLESLPDDPYDSGWLVKIKVADPAGLGRLMDHATYQKHCQEES